MMMNIRGLVTNNPNNTTRLQSLVFDAVDATEGAQAEILEIKETV